MDQSPDPTFNDALIATLRQVDSIEPKKRTRVGLMDELCRNVAEICAGDVDAWLKYKQFRWAVMAD
jgi:hypothetical protein